MPTKENKEIFKKLIFLFKPYIKRIAGILLCMLLSAGINILIPLISRRIVDDCILKDNFYLLVKLVFSSFLLVLTDQSIGMLETRFRSHISAMMPYELSKMAFKHILKLNIRYFNNTNFAEIMNNINMDVNNISRISDRSLFFIVAQMFKMAGGLTGLFLIDWKLATLVLVIIPAKYIIVKVLARKRMKLFTKYMEVNREYSAWYGDTISGIKEIKLLGIDKVKTGEFIKRQRDIVKFNIKMNILDRFNELSETVLFEIFTGLLYILGAYQIFHSNFTLGGLMAFITYSVYVTAPISAILNIGYNFSNVIPSAKRFYEFMEMECEGTSIHERRKNVANEKVIGNIKYENVSFSFDNKKNVLRDISFEILNGQKIAVIGANGSGKTTLVNLLLRFFQPTKGKILLDGKDISNIPLKQIRSLISVVSQDIYLFNATVRENILPRSSGTDMRVYKAAKDSQIHDFIESLSQKYDTRVGVNGANLSGGQKQKIAMARAIARDTKILILDEATSSYDMESEINTIDLIMNQLKNKTVIMITHKSQILKAVDRIIMIENGSIADVGTHGELYSRNNGYRDILDNYNQNMNVS